jgi:hypothetical protein
MNNSEPKNTVAVKVTVSTVGPNPDFNDLTDRRTILFREVANRLFSPATPSAFEKELSRLVEEHPLTTPPIRSETSKRRFVHLVPDSEGPPGTR